MHCPRRNHFQWIHRTLLIVSLLFCALLPTTPAPAAETAEPDSPCPETTVTLAPNLRTLLFKRVAVLPFQADDPQLTALLTGILYSALADTKKYALLPASAGAGWLSNPKKSNTTIDIDQQATSFGRAVKARGVIQADISLHDNLLRTEKQPATSLVFTAQMTDAQSGNNVWRLRTVCQGPQSLRQLTAVQIATAIKAGLQELIRTMVSRGDIFSSVLPRPTVISTRGELRKIRIILQPDPPYTYSAYQLLSAESPDGIFTTHTAPVANDHAPIILEDNNLLDGKSYAYTVIGITEKGLANVPAPPFTVTTSGAPKPLDSLQATGNTLRAIRLLWPPSQDPNVTGYRLYRSTAPDEPFEKIADIDNREQQTYIDYGAGRHDNYGSLADDTLYYYTIRTTNRLGVESKAAPVISARTKGAPLPPTEVRAIERQPGRIPLSWSPGEDPDIKGYAILRSENGREPFQQIDFVRGRETQEYTDSGSWNSSLNNNFTYFYKLRSINVLDMASTDSTIVSAATKAAPAAVQSIRVTNNQFRKVGLEWQSNPENDISSYTIFRGQTGDDLDKIATVPAPETSYVDSGLRDGTTYWYQVRAIDSDQLKGKFFPPVSATTKPMPTAPTGLGATLVDGNILLQWKKNPEPDIDHFEIFSIGFLTTRVGESRDTTFLYNDNLEPGSVYRFQIRAVDKNGLASNYSRQTTLRIPESTKLKKEE